MVQVMHLYLDESGTRHPDKIATVPQHGRDWFSIGGVLIKQEDEPKLRVAHAEYMGHYNLDPDAVYLHSAEIRNRTDAFTWLAGLEPDALQEFMERTYRLMATVPVIGFACVIDRPGYNARYFERYGRQRWNMCKTAFSVVAERAAKYARQHHCKLKVFVERSDRVVDGWMQGYYDHLRSHGMPFDNASMGKYAPLSQQHLKETLYEFKTKFKSSPPMQIADLYLWPMAIGGYDRANRTYARLVEDEKLIDSQLTAEEIPVLGIKYSCWELVQVRS
jgi:hypothetical protein